MHPNNFCLTYISYVVTTRENFLQCMKNYSSGSPDRYFLNGTERTTKYHKFMEKKLRESVKQIICPIELKSWKIDCASHQYSDSSPISGSLMD